MSHRYQCRLGIASATTSTDWQTFAYVGGRRTNVVTFPLKRSHRCCRCRLATVPCPIPIQTPLRAIELAAAIDCVQLLGASILVNQHPAICALYIFLDVKVIRGKLHSTISPSSRSRLRPATALSLNVR